MERQDRNQIKEDPNLITVFICFLRSGLRFTRFDTNNVGLAFIDEIKKVNPNFKPKKVEQRERDQIHIVNAYPKEFEQLIMSLIEEYRIKHKMEYRLKKPRGGNRGGGSRQGGYGQNSGYRRSSTDAPRPRREAHGSGDTNRGFRPGGRPTGGTREDNQRVSGIRPRLKPETGSDQNGDAPKRPRRPRKDIDE